MRMNLSQLCMTLLITLLISCTGTTISDPSQLAGSDTGVATASSSQVTHAEDEVEDELTVNLLVSAQGTVHLKRSEWSDYYRTDFGSQLQSGDLLRVAEDSRAVVLCDGLRTRQVPAGSPTGLNNLCPPPEEKILVRGGVFLGNTRGGHDPFIPYVISPRKTLLLNPTPELRWNAVPGASSYTVTVKGEGVDWVETVTEPSIVYPGEPALVPGAAYAITVQADTGESSQDEGVQGLGFTVVDAATALRIEANVARIMALELDAEGKELALGQYLAGEGLIAEAIETLETLVQEVPAAPFPYRMLGDLYRQSGLNLLALEHYEAAVALADTSDNLEAAALAREGLAEVSLALGDREAAATLLRAAIDLYRLLGDAEQADALKARLEENGL